MGVEKSQGAEANGLSDFLKSASDSSPEETVKFLRKMKAQNQEKEANDPDNDIDDFVERLSIKNIGDGEMEDFISVLKEQGDQGTEIPESGNDDGLNSWLSKVAKPNLGLNKEEMTDFLGKLRNQ